jgi:hypothetical protein
MQSGEAMKTLLAIMFGLILCFVSGCGVKNAWDAADQSEKDYQAAREKALKYRWQPSPPPVVTSAKYGQIREGMTYEQVSQVIGTPGEEMSRVALADYTTVMYVWKNADGSNMNVTFQNGRLVAKAQFGLP